MSVKQVGSCRDCGKKGCPNTPSWRVILGKWNVQVYTCSAHLPWGVELDLIRDETGKKLGWEYGHQRADGDLFAESTRVVPTLRKLERMDFSREVAISRTFPTRNGEWA